MSKSKATATIDAPKPIAFAGFNDEEFASDKVELAYCQVLNDKNDFGFFISSDNAEMVKFEPDANWSLHTQTFNNGDRKEGFLTTSPRMIIIQNGNLTMYEKGERGKDQYVGSFNKSRYIKGSMVLKTRYLVFFVNDKNEPLHEVPLLYTAKGTFGYQFSNLVRTFRTDVNNAYKKLTKTTKSRDAKFYTLSALSFTVKADLVGDTQKSWSTVVDQYTKPTEANLAEFVVDAMGDQPELKSKLLETFEEFKDFGKVERQETSEAADEETENSEPTVYELWASAKVAGLTPAEYLNSRLEGGLKAYKEKFLALDVVKDNNIQSPSQIPDNLIDQILAELRGETLTNAFSANDWD